MDRHEKEPFISVVVACYNSAKYLPKLAETLAQQKMKDFEVVFVNDGGTDNTPEVVNELSEKYSDMKIRYVYTPNGGTAHCRNVGLQNAQGKYLFFCDGDDYLLPDALEILEKEAKRSGADRILAEKLTCSEDGKVLANQELPEYPSTWNFTAVHGTLMKREVFLKNGVSWKEGVITEDVYMSFLFSKFCDSVSWVREPTYCWVMHTVSITSASNSKRASEETGAKTMTEIFSYALPILSSLSEDAHASMEYELIRLYAFVIFRNYRYAPVGITLKGYKKLHSLFSSELPDYKKNKYIFSGKKAPLRKFTRRAVACLVLSEKMHLSWLLLIMYHIAAKIITFQV